MTSALMTVLDRQDRIVRRTQALDHMSLERLRHLLGRDWQVLLPGVYATFTGSVSPQQHLRAALLYAGDDAMLADVTALTRYGVRYLPATAGIHVLIPACVKRASRDGVVVRRTHRMPPPRRMGDLPCCPPERALVEMAARICDRRAATAAMADAVQRNIAVGPRLISELPHVTGRGAGVARAAVMNVAERGARSAPEADFLSMCARVREIPAPLVNPLLELPDGSKASPDALFKEAAVIHETNGREPHAGEDDFKSMQARHDALTAAGFVVLHNSPRRLSREPDQVMREVLTCIQRHAGTGLPDGVRLLRAGPPGSLWSPPTNGPLVVL